MVSPGASISLYASGTVPDDTSSVISRSIYGYLGDSSYAVCQHLIDILYIPVLKKIRISLCQTRSLSKYAMKKREYVGQSYTRSVIYMASGAVTWSSKKIKSTIYLSSTEGKYIATSNTVREAEWLRNLLLFMGIRSDAAILLLDNQPAIQLAKYPIFHPRTKIQQDTLPQD